MTDFGDLVLGGGLPPAVEALIGAAGASYHTPMQALTWLQQARALAPEHPAVLIALYRFYFYQHRLAEALDIARQALQVGAAALAIPSQWRQVEPDERFAAFDAAPRFYLFALKGYAYLSLRLGDAAEAGTALAKLRQLDPLDRVGGSVVQGVLDRAGQPDDED